MRYIDGHDLYGPDLPTDSNDYPELGPPEAVDPDWPGYNGALARWSEVRWDRRNRRWEPR